MGLAFFFYHLWDDLQFDVFLPIILGKMQKLGLGLLDLKIVLLCWGDTLNEQLPVVLDLPFAEAEQRQNVCLGILPAATL